VDFFYGKNQVKSDFWKFESDLKKTIHGKTSSCAIGLDRKDTSKALDLVIDKVKNDTPFFGIISLRFVKGTSATLGFTKFQNTCVMEIDGVDGKKTKKFYEEVCH